MCGIVGAVARSNAIPILIEGLSRLEYRGYDSAGVAVINQADEIERYRQKGKVAVLSQLLDAHKPSGTTGIAHTRWATHGIPSEQNAHPHLCNGEVAVVHNGIIENHEALRQSQTQSGYRFTSETDTEVIAHLIHEHLQQQGDLLKAVQTGIQQLRGAYAIAVILKDEPGRMVVAREGSPLVIGVGDGEYFIASDVAALLPQTNRFIYLEEGDVADVHTNSLSIYDRSGQKVERSIKTSQLNAGAVERGEFAHYMLKEIYEQPFAVTETLEGRISHEHVIPQAFGTDAEVIFKQVKRIKIIACGTSYHAGLVARYWLEELCRLPTSVEVASEFRYGPKVVEEDTLFITLSQSGETADTLAALRAAKGFSYLSTLAVCNVAESSLVRESDLVLMTRAGPEIGVASTKAFTTQLVALLLLTLSIAKVQEHLKEADEIHMVESIKKLPRYIENILDNEDDFKGLAHKIATSGSALFLGRGAHYPIAMEGALKLKEISYIHAEAYPAGELKHGPLALIDEKMPVIAVAPNDPLMDKLKSNLEEVKARGGRLYVIAEKLEDWNIGENDWLLAIQEQESILSPILFSIPLQLIAYHAAVLKGTDVDQPRNLAKSVTVE